MKREKETIKKVKEAEEVGEEVEVDTTKSLIEMTITTEERMVNNSNTKRKSNILTIN
jgi:hypothetical protein